MSKKKLILVDGTLYLYRSYYKFFNLYNSNNFLISAIYGMIFLIKKIICIYNPEYLSIIFDFPSKNFRKIIFNKYKSNRSPCPKDLILQIPIINEIIISIGINIISIPSVESDDIIGTLSNQGVRNGFNVIIITTDKDMIQLVTKNIKIYDIFSSNKIIGPEEVYFKYKIYPKNIVDYFSLTGDYTDNIPGIYGIGPKTAKILIEKFNNLKNMYINIDKINKLKIRNSEKIIEKLKIDKNKLFLFYDLIKIKTDIFTGYKLSELKIKKTNIRYLNKLFLKYNLFFDKNSFDY